MENVTFDVDHINLDRGLYLAKVDELNGVSTFTFDLRNRAPYDEDVMTYVDLHSYEHAFATAVRNVESDLKIIYFGPMGCATGFYLLVQGDSDKYNEDVLYEQVVDLMDKAMDMVDQMDAVPAKSKIQCGNAYSLGEAEDIHRVNKDIRAIMENVKSQRSFDQYEYVEDEQFSI